MKKKNLISIIAIAAALIAVVTAVIVFRKQIGDMFSRLKEKIHPEEPDFTPEEFEDFADI